MDYEKEIVYGRIKNLRQSMQKKNIDTVLFDNFPEKGLTLKKIKSEELEQNVTGYSC